MESLLGKLSFQIIIVEDNLKYDSQLFNCYKVHQFFLAPNIIFILRRSYCFDLYYCFDARFFLYLLREAAKKSSFLCGPATKTPPPGRNLWAKIYEYFKKVIFP